MVTAFKRPGDAGDPESWHRRMDGDGAPDRGDARGAADRPARRPETEAQAAERLGLTGLNRSDAHDSLRAKADAQEAEIRQHDARTRTGDADGGRSEADTGRRDNGPGQPERRDSPPSEPGRDDRGSMTPESWMAHWTAEPAEDRLDRDPERGPHYWTEVPRFQATWHRLEERWPHADRPPEGGSRIDPERRAMAEEAAEKVRDAEPFISDDIREIAAENASGGWLEGFDRFRLKGHDRLMEKVADKLLAEADRPASDIVREIPDAVRYTFCFDTQSYSNGYWDVKERLERCGYEMYYSRNSWTDPEYKGVNTRWITPLGQRFEVQFHTRESFHAKHEVTHLAYERARDPRTGRTELAELEGFQREVSSWIPVPDRVSEITDYKKKGY